MTFTVFLDNIFVSHIPTYVLSVYLK